jgi:hypothetical protein
MIALGYKMARLSRSAREEMPEGDFRDWKEIETWTKSITTELKTAREEAVDSGMSLPPSLTGPSS